MTELTPYAKEHIGYRRSTVIPGLEILDAYRSPREWRVIAYEFAVTFLNDWRGEVRYRGRVSPVERGIAFCNYPGEALIATPEANRIGSFNVLQISEELMQEWVSERGCRARRPEWQAIFPRLPADVWTKFQRVSALLTQQTPALQLQSDAAELAESMVRGLVAGVSDRAPGAGPAIRGTARMRECLNEGGFGVDLETLAQRAGLSKFQALRAFKRRYGLPPHEYQMCLRIRNVRQMLLAGAPPAEAAVHSGFVDQSHMIRHFKRIVGVTPMRYVRSGAHRKIPAIAELGVRYASLLVERGDRHRS